MFYHQLLGNLTSMLTGARSAGRADMPRRAARSSLLRVEPLEDRRLLSAATTTTIAAHPGTAQYGQPVALVAKVASTTTGTPTGSVTFYEGSASGTVLGTATLNQRGTARLYEESTPLPVDASGTTDAVFAVYSGDTNFTTSTGSSVLTVNQASTNTVVFASPNPGVTGGNVTFTAIVNGAAPQWANNGGTITPPTGSVTFMDGTTALTGTVDFVGDSGSSAIYTFTTATASLTGTSNSITASYSGDSNYLASTSRALSYSVVSTTVAGTGTITAGSATSPLSLRGGQTFSISYSSTGTSNAVTYVDANKGISLGDTTITAVVFGANGQAEISGTGTNTNSDGSTTPVNFTLYVSTGSNSGWHRQPDFSISIIGSTPLTTSTGTGLEYNKSGSVSSDDTVTVTGTGTATIPAQGGLPGAHDEALRSWHFGRGGFGGGYGGGYGGGSGGGEGGDFGFSFRGHGRR